MSVYKYICIFIAFLYLPRLDWKYISVKTFLSDNRVDFLRFLIGKVWFVTVSECLSTWLSVFLSKLYIT